MNSLNHKNIELIRRTVAETVDILVSDPDFGLVLRPDWKREVVKRLKNYKKSKFTSFSKIKKQFANA